MNKILIVEDDTEIRTLIARYLSANGFAVIEAGEARAMDAAISESRIALIVLDIMLPGEDGLSVCRRLRAASDIPIVIVTAEGRHRTHRRVGDGGRRLHHQAIQSA